MYKIFPMCSLSTIQGGQVENEDNSDISDFFSNFSTVPFSPIVKYENLDHKNLRFSNICLLDIFLISNTKTWITKIRDFQTSEFSIFAYSQIRILDFKMMSVSLILPVELACQIFRLWHFQLLTLSSVIFTYETTDIKMKSEILVLVPGFQVK